MRLDQHAAAVMAAGLDRIRAELAIPDSFPPEVEAAAEAAAVRKVGSEHVDRTDVEFSTIDPATSTDLDQAFAIEMDGNDVVLRYAIADVGWFVQPGDVLDTEAWSRGVTVYLPDRRSSLYPPKLSEGAASLLPGVDRPAVLFVVRVDPEGAVKLDAAERAVVRSRVKLAYDSVTPADLPQGFAELAARIVAAEAARGAPRVAFPEQEVDVRPDNGFELRYRPRTPAEEQNAAMSLAANTAIAPRGACVTALRRSGSSGRRASRWRRSRGRCRATIRARRRSSSPCAEPAEARATRRTATASVRGTRPWRRRTPTPRLHCAGSRIAT